MTATTTHAHHEAPATAGALSLGREMTTAEDRIKGYIIVDKVTGEIDWDCDLHPTREAAIASMCGPDHMYVESPEDVDDRDRDRISVYWADDYEICTVLKAEAAAS